MKGWKYGWKYGGAMPSRKRYATKYPGVFYREAKKIGATGVERVYYIVFKKDGKVIEEKVGRQFVDNMTPAKAAGIRSDRIEGKRLSRKELRYMKQAEKNKPTFQNLWELYQLRNAEKKSLRNDISNYKNYISRFASLLPEELRTTDIVKLRDELLSNGLKPQTVKLVLGQLRGLINFGVKNGLCKQPDPSQLYFEMPKVDNTKTETLSGSQLKKYFEALAEEPDQNAANFLRLALATGMRKGAIMALRWDDLDFEQGFITLRGEVAKKGKTDRIPMSNSAKQILLHTEQTDSPYVFPGRYGGQRKDFQKIARRVRDRAGLPKDFRPLHGLRHAFASFLASSGKVDLYTLQKLLTHSSPQMTQRYAHLADEALQRAANVSDSIFILTKKNDHDE